MDRVDVTVVICTWNRQHLLRQTLDSLTRVAAPRDASWSVLVVNNNSTDATDAVVDSYLGALPIRRTFEAQAGLSRARNRALAEISGTHVLFTDDDALPEPQWLEAFVQAARKYPDAAAFGGPIRPVFETPPDPLMAEVFPALGSGFCGQDHRLEEGPLPEDCNLFGANFGFRVSAITSLRFDESLGHTGDNLIGGEDIAFLAGIRRSGVTVIWCPAMVVHHLIDPSRLSASYIKRYCIGRGGEAARLAAAGPAKTLLDAPRWAWRLCGEEFFRFVGAKVAGDRPAALRHLRNHWFTRGYIRQARAGRHHGGGSPAGGGNRGHRQNGCR